ncbi:haloacid dehalogenase [Bifidobacterium aemilianum]|uniref:Haloacid dehalogenase n=1 Tax=Bifidobacterium aemilianum TaxID=2493120 RepID=A0A366K9M6_9BIFI|nr:HAD-IC family P-type ATPase [Bifidobacterium aemilianum]RBP98299.1 haloacid dehalogenase [Bifidobacterium aemilianum]
MPEVSEQGLSQAQVRSLTEEGKVNALKEETSRSLGQIIRANVFTLFNGIIVAAMLLVLLTGSWKDAVFGIIIIFNTGIGIGTELKAKLTLDKLSILVSSRSLVRRHGGNIEIDHGQIVLGDLLWVRSGEQIPADSTIVHTWGLELDESMLTGESRTVRKGPGDQVYSGSNAVSGLALVRVDQVGEHGYAAKLAAKARVYKKTTSDLTQGINTILKVMTVVVIPLCLLLIWSQIRAVGGWQTAIGTGLWRQAVVSAVAGVVGMIPEGLVLLTSLNFAIASIRLARENTLVQELESVETLARVDSLNLDKTGTITDGSIVLDDVVLLDGQIDGHIVRQAFYDLSNEANPNGTGQAVLAGLSKEGYQPGPVQGRVPFSSARKWSAIIEDGTLWTMGAPELLLSAFEGDSASVAGRVDGYAKSGSRVLLLARKSLDSVTAADSASQSDEGGFDIEGFMDSPTLFADSQPVALVLCSEHIREDAQPTLAWFRDQGVRCRVISGDNPVTVGAIAAKVGLTGDQIPRIMDARQLPSDLNQLAVVMEDVDVLGRVLPEQKKAIVDALHAKGHVVAMTGDGVNDALALKEADLGIAMGNAAAATKAVAQLVLVDSKFSHLPDVVARGRQVMANMERVASLFLVKTVYSALISLGVVLTAIPFPYLPRHITYIGGLTIGLPAFILALAPNNRRYIPGFLKRVVHFALPGGIAIALSVLLSAWLLPPMLHWNLSKPSDLATLRTTCAIVVFVLGVFVLGRVAMPLKSWRGLLVAFFAAVGVIGIFVPPVANFFALSIPSDRTLRATMIVLVLAAAIYAITWLISRLLGRSRKTATCL